MAVKRFGGLCLFTVLAAVFARVIALASEGQPEQLLQSLQESPHALVAAQSVSQVKDHELGLGALQKISGAWRFKRSERYSGELSSYTWQIVDGFTSIEVLADVVAGIEKADADAWELLFSCDGRACGHGSQWANRVFRQRILYGREDLQRYRIYSLSEEGVEYRLVIYASARTADRQYLHLEILRLDAAE